MKMKDCIVVDIHDMPSVIWELRHEMAKILRNGARDEDPRTARRLRDIANIFETGASEEHTT